MTKKKKNGRPIESWVDKPTERLDLTVPKIVKQIWHSQPAYKHAVKVYMEGLAKTMKD